MDDFVKKAFADATKSAENAEAKAFVSRIANNIEIISMACGIAVGLDEMNKLSGVILKGGVAETFSEWTRNIMNDYRLCRGVLGSQDDGWDGGVETCHNR